MYIVEAVVVDADRVVLCSIGGRMSLLANAKVEGIEAYNILRGQKRVQGPKGVMPDDVVSTRPQDGGTKPRHAGSGC